MQKLCIAIVGQGPAGQAAAIFLSRSGHQIFEKVQTPKPVGAGFLTKLQPTAFKSLKKLGIFDKVLDHGSRIEHLYGSTLQGRTVLDLQYGQLHPELFGLGMYRGTLFSHLLDEMKKIPTLHMIAAKDIVDIQQCADNYSKVDLVESSENILRKETTNGMKRLVCGNVLKEFGPFDLVVVADGARSALRSRLHRKASSEFEYQWGTLWSILEDPDGEFTKAHGKTLRQVFDGTSKMMGLLPTGFRPNRPHSHPLITIFWSLHKKDLDHWKSSSFDDWRTDLLRVAPHASSIISQIKDRSQVMFGSYLDVRMFPYCNSTKNVIFIGDAAHAMSPVLGQGVNLALNDARLLDESISIAKGKLPEALDRYCNMRRSTYRYYQVVSRFLNPWFQSSKLWGVGLTRDLLFGPVSKFSSTFQRQMLMSLAGSKDGFFDFNGNHTYKYWEDESSKPNLIT